MKATYEGLMTRRITVECQQVIAGSTAKLKVKTDTTTEEWKENFEDGISTTLSSTSDPLSI